MTEPTPEVSPQLRADALNEALVGFTGCVGEALEGICSVGLTIGEAYVPFEPDDDEECDEDDAYCSQAWVRVEGVRPEIEESFEAGGCAARLFVTIEVGVMRCFTIPDKGEAPTATDVLVASMQGMDDMQAIFCAAMNCEVWVSIEASPWQPLGPMGGQYGGVWTFTAELDPYGIS